MKTTSLLAGPAVALAIGLLAGSAEAAPAGSALGAVKVDPVAASAVEKTHWRWRRHRYYSYPGYYYYPRRHYRRDYYYPRHHYRSYGWWGHRRPWRRHHRWW